MKKVILTSVIVFFISLYADSNSTSKVEEIKRIQKEEKRAKEMRRLLEYDPIAVQIGIEKDIKAVEIYKRDTLDKLGPNQNCHIVASRIRLNKEKIEKYKKYKETKTSKYEIEKARKNIEIAKKDCPNYLQFTGDK